MAAEIVEELRAAGLDAHDLGFGELAVRLGQPAAGVVILSVCALPAGVCEAYAAARLRELGDGAVGHLAMIEPGRIRVRPLPARE